MSAAELPEYADRISELRRAKSRERRARRNASWTAARDFLLSIPAGIGVRLGG